MLRDCTSLEDTGDGPGEEKEGRAHVTVGTTSAKGEGAVFRVAKKTTKWYEVLLDNETNVSIIHPRLLTHIRRATAPTRVTGISDTPVELSLEGSLTGFFRVLSSHDSPANVLCMADVEDLYRVTYNQGVSFVVHMKGKDLVFRRRDKMYLGDMREWETFPSDSNDTDSDSDDDELPDTVDPSDSDDEEEPERPVAMVTTVAGNMSKLTHKEARRVKAVRELIALAGYPSLKEAAHLVENGNIIDL